MITSAGTIEVCASCPVRSVKSAVILAKEGDTIRVRAGVYEEHNIQVKKSLVIIGEKHAVIDAGKKGTVFSIRGKNASIQRLTIRNTGHSFTKEYAAVLLSHATGFNITGNSFENIFFAVLAEKSSDGVIARNRISGNATDQVAAGNGIHLWHSKNIRIRNNIISHMRDGIYLEFGSDCNIAHNIAINNLRYGLHFMFSDNNSYLENSFENNGAGVAVMFSKFIKMHRNTFKKNWGPSSYGLLLKEITDSELTQNTFDNNTIGIHAEGTTRMTFSGNDFSDNGYAIKIRGACYNNTFFKNNFLYNAFDLSYSGRINENNFDHNYWTDYSGYDLDRDGVGDVPYRPVKLFSYLTGQVPEAIVLLRSTFVGLLDFSERVSPIFTPARLVDNHPEMKKVP